MKLTYDGQFNTALLLDQIEAAGAQPGAVRLFYKDGTLTIKFDDTSGIIEQAVRDVAASHDASQLSNTQRTENDRDTIQTLFGLDTDDRSFLVQLTQGFELAETNQVAPRTVYSGLRTLVDASPKHRDEINYWFELEEGIPTDRLQTALQKRAYVKCVRRYYATKLAPALTVWLLGNRV